ncbi:hypothetical protein PAPHI01_1362 [Pancytospora philotis]|nr:hypothetical protein PAPHI01_1362 [Pancytospora philotis]
MDAQPSYSVLFGSFRAEKRRPNLYIIGVPGDDAQGGYNNEWLKLGKCIARHLIKNRQSAVLLSCCDASATVVACDFKSAPENSAAFEHEGKVYNLTAVDSAQIAQVLPDIIEGEGFVFCLNVWLYFFDEEVTAQALCCDSMFLDEAKRLVTNLCSVALFESSYEMIIAIPDGREMLWFNPHGNFD